MRRIAIAVMGTISGLVLLFSYHTSTNTSETSAGSGDPGTTGTSEPTQTGQGTNEQDSGSQDSEDSRGRHGKGAQDRAGTEDGSNGSGSSSGSTGSGDSGGSGSLRAGTWTGQEVSTRWGTVQVRITVQDGRITAAQALQYPNDNPKDVEINSYAVPVLQEQTVSRQSADLDGVSGATVTSEGYVRSLQSAIDQAS